MLLTVVFGVSLCCEKFIEVISILVISYIISFLRQTCFAPLQIHVMNLPFIKLNMLHNIILMVDRPFYMYLPVVKIVVCD